jgi:DNA polymerase V
MPATHTTSVATAIAHAANTVPPTLDQAVVALSQNPPSFTQPLFLSPVQAGFPSPATDYIEDGLDLNAYLVQHTAASFLFHVKGQSMQGAGIVDGDKVVVDRSVEAQHGSIVIAVVDGDYTIKRLFRRGARIELRAENAAFKPICFNPDSQLEIWGVVVGVVRRYPN